MTDLARYCAETFPEVVAQVRPLQNGPPVANPIEMGAKWDKILRNQGK